MIGSLGGGELILLFVLALLIFGPRKLPTIGKTIGKALSEFRRATTDFKSSLEHEVHLSEVESARREMTEAVDEVKGVARGSIVAAEDPADQPRNGADPAPPPGQDGSRSGNS